MADEMIIPFVLIGKHPVETSQFEINTLAIKQLRTFLAYVLDGNKPGCIVYSPSRFGKSWSVRYIKEHKLPNKNVPIVTTRIPRDSNLTNNQFIELLLENFGHADPYSDTAKQKTRRLAEYLYKKAKESGADAIYIFIDEAHELDESHFSWLCNLYDTLFDDYRIQPCFVLLAEPIMEGRTTSFHARCKTQVISRLMTEEFEFPGITTVDEIKFCLKQYDEVNEYPPGSGWTYTRYFFPKAYDSAKWRLASQSELLFQAFKQTHEKAKVKWDFVIPMESLIRCLKYVLIANKTTDCSFAGFTFDDLVEAVEFSGYINATSYMEKSKKLNRGKSG